MAPPAGGSLPGSRSAAGAGLGTHPASASPPAAYMKFFNLYPSFSGSNSLDIPVLKGQERQEGYRQQGLYDSRLEHDACGIVAVVDIKGASIAAPTRAHRPPTMWLAAEPAKS